MAIGVNWKEIWKPIWKPVWVGAGTGPADDTTPLPFVFIDQTNVARGIEVTSNFITVNGIDAPSPISIVGGTYEINQSGIFTYVAGEVLNGDVVRVRHTSSLDYLGEVTTILTIGGVSGSFTSYTLQDVQEVRQIALQMSPHKYVNEASSCAVKVRFFGEDGSLVDPVNARYLIRDLTNNRIVKDWTAFDPQPTTNILITASENTVYNDRRRLKFEKRVVTVQCDYDTSTQKTNEIEYWIRNLYGIVSPSN